MPPRILHLYPTPVLLAFTLAFSVLSQPPAQTPPQVWDAPVAALIRTLRRAIRPQRDGSHLAALLALRQLDDPALEPLFRRLVGHEQWPVQVHAVLGLVELDPHQRLDPRWLAKVSPEAQEPIIINALDMKAMDQEAIVALLAEDFIQPAPRAILLAELSSRGGPVDRKVIAKLAQDKSLPIAGLASCLLVQEGQPDALNSFLERLQKLAPRRRDHHLIRTFAAIQKYKLHACADWICSVLSAPELDDGLTRRGIIAVLNCNLPHGLNRLRDWLGTSPDRRRRMLGVMLLLEVDAPLPADAFIGFEPEDEDDDLLLALTEAGRAVTRGQNEADALLKLLELGHLASSDWAMNQITTLPTHEAVRAYGTLLDRLESADSPSRPTGMERAVRATIEMYRLDPPATLTRLAAAPDDGLLQQAILLGLFDADAPDLRLELAARSIRRIGSGKPDSLALLLIARHTEMLDQPDLKQLGRIASGGGQVSEILRLHAIWLFLRHSGRIEEAQRQIFPE